MTEPNETALRRRRAQVHLDSDPLQVFVDERARYERLIEEMVESHASETTRLILDLKRAEDERNSALKEFEQFRQLTVKAQKEEEAAWEHARLMLIGQPEAKIEGRPIVEGLGYMITRLTNERNGAVEKVGEVIALLERVEPFLNKSRRMMDNQTDLGDFRREAAALYAGVGTERASGPFMASLVAAVRAAAGLHQALGGLLDVGLLGENTKKADLKLGTELAGVPSVFKQPEIAINVPLMKRRQIRIEEEKWNADEEAKITDESFMRTMKTLNLITEANGTTNTERRDAAKAKLANSPVLTMVGDVYAERRDAGAAKRRDTMQAKKLDAQLRKAENAQDAAILRATKKALVQWNDDQKIGPSPILPYVDTPRPVLVAFNETPVFSDLLTGDGTITIGESWQPVDGWPAVPNTSGSANYNAGWENGEIITRQERNERGEIVGVTTTGGRYKRTLDGSYEPEDSG